MTSILFHINHPAHYHLFKNVIKTLKSKGHTVSIIARNKDVLTQLLDNDGLSYINTHKSPRENNLISLIINQLSQFLRIKKIVKEINPDLLIGTSFILPYVSKRLKIPYINVLEDDAHIVPIYSRFSLSQSDYILAPHVCKLGKWENKKLGYNSYHELAFLHPNQFTPEKKVAEKYIETKEKNFLIRFTAFNAHHDYGKKGIDFKTAEKLINQLHQHGNVFISSEGNLPLQFEKYRLTINPNDIHHVMAFCSLIIGDSQSMAMEAACLGVPSVRMNDYASRISYLEEMEQEYQLSYSFTPQEKSEFLKRIISLLSIKDFGSVYKDRQQKLIEDKCDTHFLITWLIVNFPKSVKTMKENPSYLTNFGGKSHPNKKYKLNKAQSNNSLKYSVLYLTTLLFFYLFPLTEKFSLNRYHYLSFRGDHIIHVLVFTPLPFLFLPLFLKQSKWRILKASFFALIIAICFELSHLFVPYRAFTFEDLTANIFGIILGLIFVMIKCSWSSKN